MGIGLMPVKAASGPYHDLNYFLMSLIKRNFFIAAKEEELRLKREEYFKNT